MGTDRSIYLSAGFIGLWVEDHFPYRSCASPIEKVGSFNQAAVGKVQLRLGLRVDAIHKHGHLKVVMILTETSLIRLVDPDDAYCPGC